MKYFYMNTYLNAYDLLTKATKMVEKEQYTNELTDFMQQYYDITNDDFYSLLNSKEINVEFKYLECKAQFVIDILESKGLWQ